MSKMPSWLQIQSVERSDTGLTMHLRVVRNWALWRELWRTVRTEYRVHWYQWPRVVFAMVRVWRRAGGTR